MEWTRRKERCQPQLVNREPVRPMNSGQTLGKARHTEIGKVPNGGPFYDLESELSRELSGIRPSGQSGQVEPDLRWEAQTVSYSVLYLGYCPLGPGPLWGLFHTQMGNPVMPKDTGPAGRPPGSLSPGEETGSGGAKPPRTRLFECSFREAFKELTGR